ncbi:MAG: hypothetical protein IK025_05995 [Bacteroidales bacterium]|nr:hypothetical protein [Bacteroidales bacterium]
MDDSNLTVNAMWIGQSLSTCELLTIKSFLNNGHRFVLWAYDDIVTPLPAGTILRDASEIIPRDKIFSYKYSNQFGHGKGSFAGFSDIFRYKLLYLHGGWWVDMDVTCLKPLDFESDYVFRSHHDLPLVGNVMKCPKGSPLMEKCYNEAVSKVDENNRDWHLPIQILVDNVKEMGLGECVKSFSNVDSWNVVRKMLYKNVVVPESWSVIHWVNEEWRRNGIDRNVFLKSSLFAELARRNDVPIEYAGIVKGVQTRFKLSLLWHGLMQ